MINKTPVRLMDVTALFLDHRNRLWCGGEDAGLNLLGKDGAFTHFRNAANDPASLSGDDVWAIGEDTRGAIWVGTYAGGLDRYDESTKRFVHFRHNAENADSIVSDNVLALRGDRAGNLWIGSDAGVDVRGSDGHFRHVDFAGSSVVHMTGGVMALVAGKLIGARRGKYNADGSVNAIPGHNIPMALLGTFILAFGWFGFNPGSTLAGMDSRIAVIATNTMLAGAAGALTAMIYVWRRYGKPDPSMLANGMLAGLVAITAPCAFVTAPSAVLIGGIAGVLVCVSVVFIERRLKIDDPVGASSVHGVCGAWGVLSLGLLADGTYGDGTNGVAGNVTGLFYGDASQLAAQLIGITTNIIWVGLTGYAAWKITSKLTDGHRVTTAIEEMGLDLPEMGALAYPDQADLSSAVVIQTETKLPMKRAS
jgi:hypothetical protein